MAKTTVSKSSRLRRLGPDRTLRQHPGMRIAAFGIHHETNTFSTFRVGLSEFQHSGLQREGVLRGDQIARYHSDTETCFGGYFKAAERYGFELIPLLFAATDPAGTISSEAFEALIGEALAMLRDHGPWDGVMLNQMGAAVSAKWLDAHECWSAPTYRSS